MSTKERAIRVARTSYLTLHAMLASIRAYTLLACCECYTSHMPENICQRKRLALLHIDGKQVPCARVAIDDIARHGISVRFAFQFATRQERARTKSVQSIQSSGINDTSGTI
jgi:hypothetical protein